MARIGFAILGMVVAVAGVYAAFRAIDQRAAPPIVIADASISQPVKVEVRGAVAEPGVYELRPGARVEDAIQAAGGLDETADLSTINLARRVRDGEVIVIAALPATGEASSERAEGGGQNA